MNEARRLEPAVQSTHLRRVVSKVRNLPDRRSRSPQPSAGLPASLFPSLALKKNTPTATHADARRGTADLTQPVFTSG